MFFHFYLGLRFDYLRKGRDQVLNFLLSKFDRVVVPSDRLYDCYDIRNLLRYSQCGRVSRDGLDGPSVLGSGDE